MDRNPNFRRTYLVCAVVLFLGFFYLFSLNYIKLNKFASVFFLFGFVSAEISIPLELVCFAGNQSPFRVADVLNGANSVSYHTGVKAEQVFCRLVADSLGEFATNGYPYGTHANEGPLGLGFAGMHFLLHDTQFPNMFQAVKVRKKPLKLSIVLHSKKHKANGNPRVRSLYPNFDLKRIICCKTISLMSKIKEGGLYPDTFVNIFNVELIEKKRVMSHVRQFKNDFVLGKNDKTLICRSLSCLINRKVRKKYKAPRSNAVKPFANAGQCTEFSEGQRKATQGNHSLKSGGTICNSSFYIKSMHFFHYLVTIHY